MINIFTEENFEAEVEKYEGTVIVDFYADWCGPCQMMSPIIDEIAKENKSIKVGKVDCDTQIGLAEKFDVMSIPTILVVKNGEVAKKFVGVTAKEDILDAIK